MSCVDGSRLNRPERWRLVFARTAAKCVTPVLGGFGLRFRGLLVLSVHHFPNPSMAIASKRLLVRALSFSARSGGAWESRTLRLRSHDERWQRRWASITLLAPSPRTFLRAAPSRRRTMRCSIPFASLPRGVSRRSAMRRQFRPRPAYGSGCEPTTRYRRPPAVPRHRGPAARDGPSRHGVQCAETLRGPGGCPAGAIGLRCSSWSS